MDPDPDPRIHASDYWIREPAIFFIDLQDTNKNLIIFEKFVGLLLF